LQHIDMANWESLGQPNNKQLRQKNAVPHD